MPSGALHLARFRIHGERGRWHLRLEIPLPEGVLVVGGGITKATVMLPIEFCPFCGERLDE